MSSGIFAAQDIFEKALEPSIVRHQRVMQESIKRAIGPPLVEHQKIIESMTQPTLAQHQQVMQEMVEQLTQPILTRNQQIIKQAIQPTIRYQSLVEQMLPALDTIHLSETLYKSPGIEETVADFEEIARPRPTPLSTEPTGVQPTDWGLTHSLGFVITTASFILDRAIEERGLDGAIGEIKRRQWVLDLVLRILGITYYSMYLFF